MEDSTAGGRVDRDLAPVFPDSEICHTKRIGLQKELAECLVDRPIGCPHVAFSCQKQFCTYPKWQDFLKE